MSKKSVAMMFPVRYRAEDLRVRYAIESALLEPLADLEEVIPEEPVSEFLRKADAVLTSWGVQIDAALIEQLENCKIIGVASVGVDMVDVEAATQAGIVVTNVPDVFIEEVADHAMMLLLSVIRQTKRMQAIIRNDDWYKGRTVLSEVPRLLGQTLGLIAFGNVARCVARRAKPFGIKVIAYDPYVSELVITGEGVEPVSFEELLERSDYVSMHAAHNEETHQMLNRAVFACMKKSAIVINTGRGPTIMESDLIEALQAGEIAGAGLDVLEQEPPDLDNPLLTMQNVVVTPHVAAQSTRMRPETRRRAAREIALVLKGKWPMSCVNPTALPASGLQRWQPVSMERGPNR